MMGIGISGQKGISFVKEFDRDIFFYLFGMFL